MTVPESPQRIHPSAIIHERARLANTVRVGPFVVIEADVTVGENTELLAGTILHSGSRVGADCRLGPYVTVGGEPMDTRFQGENSYALIHDRVVMREFASLHRATGEGQHSSIGEDCLVMSYAHVSHNVQVGRGCVLTTNVQLGGHCEVGDFAVLGSSAMLHQHCRVGAYAMYGAGSATNQDILPFSLARGNPAKHYRLNKVGLERKGITGERYKRLEHAIRAFRRRDWAHLDALAADSDDVKLLLEFRASSKRGVCAFV